MGEAEFKPNGMVRAVREAVSALAAAQEPAMSLTRL
jgi:hypothetical protein